MISRLRETLNKSHISRAAQCFLSLFAFLLLSLQAEAATSSSIPAALFRPAHAAETQSPPDLAALLSIEDGEKKTAGMQQAIKYYEHYLAVHPDDVASWQKLGKLYSWTNKIDLAVITYQAAIRIDANNLSLKTDLARIYRWAQRLPEAEVLYKSVLETDTSNQQALKGLASIYLKMGNYPRAQELFDRALSLYPGDAELHKEQGVLLAWQKQYGKAIGSLKKAIQLAPDMTDAYTTLGDVYFWNRQYLQAIDEYKHALTLEPNSHELQLAIAKTYLALNDPVQAETHAENALRLNPVSMAAKELLAQINKNKLLIHWEYWTEYLEFAAILFIVALTGQHFWANRSMLFRRHRMVYYLISLGIPVVALLSLTELLAETQMKTWLGIDNFGNIASTLALILFGIMYRLQLRYAGRDNTRSADQVILVIGAHPDDIELGCGGYIFRAKSEGAKVYGLTLTKGERGTDTVNVREKEAREAAFFMGLDDYWIRDFADTRLQDNLREVKESIETIIKKISPTMVLVHNPHDHHADHRAAFVSAKEAARHVPVILCYETVSTPEEFKPDYYVDITDHLNEMLRSVSIHKSQSQKSYMNTKLLKGRAAHRGIQSGVPYAMAFQVYRIIDR